jgi:purine-binding chemotaxis protein CheW
MTSIRALLIPVGDDVYALEAAVVREVVSEPQITALPTAVATILGVFNLRGEVVPVFDTAALLGLGRIPAVSFVLVATTSAGLAGLVLSGLPKVAVLEDHAGPSELRGTRGTYVFSEGVAVLLDVEALLAQPTATASVSASGDHHAAVH